MFDSVQNEPPLVPFYDEHVFGELFLPRDDGWLGGFYARPNGDGVEVAIRAEPRHEDDAIAAGRHAVRRLEDVIPDVLAQVADRVFQRSPGGWRASEVPLRDRFIGRLRLTEVVIDGDGRLVLSFDDALLFGRAGYEVVVDDGRVIDVARL
jgi:hypothetical protein